MDEHSPVTWQQLDAALRPVLVRELRPDADPVVVALCLLNAGLDPRNGFTGSEVRGWLRKADTAGVTSALTSRAATKTWTELVKKARGNVKKTYDPKEWEYRALQISRALVCRLLSAATEHDKVTMVNARAVYTLCALRAIESVLETGMRTILISQLDIAAALGIDAGTVRRSMKLLGQLKWIKATPHPVGMRVGIRLQLPAGLGGLSYTYSTTIDALAVRRPDVDEAELAPRIVDVEHQAFTYGGLGLKLWLIGVVDAAHVDVRTLGINRAAAPALRRHWADLVGQADTIEQALHHHAEISGAYARQEDVMREREADREARTTEARAIRKAKAEARERARMTKTSGSNMPAPKSAVPAAAQVFDRITISLPPGYDSAQHGPLLEQLIERMYGGGYSLDVDSINVDAGTAQAIRPAAA